jgi:hypothetical protein
VGGPQVELVEKSEWVFIVQQRSVVASGEGGLLFDLTTRLRKKVSNRCVST